MADSLSGICRSSQKIEFHCEGENDSGFRMRWLYGNCGLLDTAVVECATGSIKGDCVAGVALSVGM